MHFLTFNWIKLLGCFLEKIVLKSRLVLISWTQYRVLPHSQHKRNMHTHFICQISKAAVHLILFYKSQSFFNSVCLISFHIYSYMDVGMPLNILLLYWDLCLLTHSLDVSLRRIPGGPFCFIKLQFRLVFENSKIFFSEGINLLHPYLLCATHSVS